MEGGGGGAHWKLIPHQSKAALHCPSLIWWTRCRPDTPHGKQEVVVRKKTLQDCLKSMNRGTDVIHRVSRRGQGSRVELRGCQFTMAMVAGIKPMSWYINVDCRLSDVGATDFNARERE